MLICLSYYRKNGEQSGSYYPMSTSVSNNINCLTNIIEWTPRLAT